MNFKESAREKQTHFRVNLLEKLHQVLAFIWTKFFPSPANNLEKIIKELLEDFKENIFYPDYINTAFYHQYFYENILRNYVLPNYIEKILKEYVSPFNILELGAFISRNAELIPEKYHEHFIISDINSDILKFNPTEYIKLAINFQNLPFKDKTFPLVLGTNVFSHILGLGNLEEIKRILKDDGKAIFIEDLPMYAQGIALFYERLGKKAFFIYDPSDFLIKCFVIKTEKFNDLQEKIREFFEKTLNIKKFIEILETYKGQMDNPDSNLMLETLIGQFEKFTQFLKSSEFANNLKLSSFLLELTIQFYLIFSHLSVSNNLSSFPELKQSFRNSLVYFRNLLSAENYCEKVRNNWLEFLSDEDFKKFLKDIGLKVNFQIIEVESGIKSLINWQKDLMKNIKSEMLDRIYPEWQKFIETRNENLNEFGLETGALGERYNLEKGIIRYQALMIILEKL